MAAIAHKRQVDLSESLPYPGSPAKRQRTSTASALVLTPPEQVLANLQASSHSLPSQPSATGIFGLFGWISNTLFGAASSLITPPPSARPEVPDTADPSKRIAGAWIDSSEEEGEVSVQATRNLPNGTSSTTAHSRPQRRAHRSQGSGQVDDPIDLDAPTPSSSAGIASSSQTPPLQQISQSTSSSLGRSRNQHFPSHLLSNSQRGCSTPGSGSLRRSLSKAKLAGGVHHPYKRLPGTPTGSQLRGSYSASSLSLNGSMGKKLEGPRFARTAAAWEGVSPDDSGREGVAATPTKVKGKERDLGGVEESEIEADSTMDGLSEGMRAMMREKAILPPKTSKPPSRLEDTRHEIEDIMKGQSQDGYLRRVHEYLTGLPTPNLRPDQKMKHGGMAAGAGPNHVWPTVRDPLDGPWPHVEDPASARWRSLKYFEDAARAAKVAVLYNPNTPTLDDIRIKDQEVEDGIKMKLQPQANRKPVPKLDGFQQDEAKRALQDRSFKAKCLREEVQLSDIVRLKPGQWLNDEIINFYGAMILKRADEELDDSGKKKRNVHFFNSFFFKKISEDGYAKSRIARWTKQIDIFSKDIVVFPINLGNMHWTCGALNFKDKRVEYYDSYATQGATKVYEVLRKYLDEEHKDKKKKPFDFEGWVDFWDSSAPQQSNGYDCGVFSCQTLEHRARGVGDEGQGEAGDTFEFEQKDIPGIRDMMVYELKHSKLMPRGV